MEIANYALALEARAENFNPEKPGDFRDGAGILHCGKCGAFMEHVLRKERINVSSAFLDSLDAEHRAKVEATRNWFDGRRVRIPCRCKEDERKTYEREQWKRAIKENINACFNGANTLLDCTFKYDKSPNTRASTVARRYSSNFKKVLENGYVLVLFGDVGHGKTYYACAVANELLQQGYRVKFTSINDIIGQASRYYLNVATVADGLCDNHLVIIDDFGVEGCNEKTLSAIYQIVNTLYERKQPYIITTNLSEDKLHSPGTTELQRIYSRIIERGTLTQVISPTGNRRLNGGT